MFGHIHVEFHVGIEGIHDFMEVGAQVFFEGVFQVVGGPAGFHEEVFHGVQFCRAGEVGGLEEVFAGGPVEAEVGGHGENQEFQFVVFFHKIQYVHIDVEIRGNGADFFFFCLVFFFRHGDGVTVFHFVEQAFSFGIHNGPPFEIYYDSIFIFYYMYSEISIRRGRDRDRDLGGVNSQSKCRISGKNSTYM